MTSVHKPNWSITAKCETNPEFMRLKKLCSVALEREIIIWQTHSISFSGCFYANEVHLYNLSKWKTDNQIPSKVINIQLGDAYAKSCSWRNSKGREVDHSHTTFHSFLCHVKWLSAMLLRSITTLVMVLQVFFSGLIFLHQHTGHFLMYKRCSMLQHIYKAWLLFTWTRRNTNPLIGEKRNLTHFLNDHVHFSSHIVATTHINTHWC